MLENYGFLMRFDTTLTDKDIYIQELTTHIFPLVE